MGVLDDRDQRFADDGIIAIHRDHQVREQATASPAPPCTVPPSALGGVPAAVTIPYIPVILTCTARRNLFGNFKGIWSVPLYARAVCTICHCERAKRVWQSPSCRSTHWCSTNKRSIPLETLLSLRAVQRPWQSFLFLPCANWRRHLRRFPVGYNPT